MSTGLTTGLAGIIALVVIVAAGIATWMFSRNRRSVKLKSKFGDAEYARSMKESGNRRQAEAELKKRAERVASFHVRPIEAAERVRFENTWRSIQERFVDGPTGAVAEADQLLGHVMSARGYPVSDFEQRAADISVDHPLVMENYRAAHEIALRQVRGQASTEDLRQAVIHYRGLFEELVHEPEAPHLKAAS
jgi:hypothetical protein